MKKFFAPNLDRRGRVARALGGAALVGAGLFACHYSLVACVALLISGGFVLYEASRGWCVMRACGIKTKI